MFFQTGNVGIGVSEPSAPLHMNGPIRMGSEQGTTEPGTNLKSPGGYNGIVVRRIQSTSKTDGNVVARTNNIRLERDGTNGGMILRWGVKGESIIHGRGYAITNSGDVIGVLAQSVNENEGGSRQVIHDEDNIVYLKFIFGNIYGYGHTTEVTLTRAFPFRHQWFGFIKTTYNQ